MVQFFSPKSSRNAVISQVRWKQVGGPNASNGPSASCSVLPALPALYRPVSFHLCMLYSFRKSRLFLCWLFHGQCIVRLFCHSSAVSMPISSQLCGISWQCSSECGSRAGIFEVARFRKHCWLVQGVRCDCAVSRHGSVVAQKRVGCSTGCVG